LSGLPLSFIIAGVFWFSPQRRLARQPLGSRGEVIAQPALSAVDHPVAVTNGLNGSYRMRQRGQRALRPAPHGDRRAERLLWWLATPASILNSPARFFVPVLLLGTNRRSFAPQYAQYFWLLAFGGLLMRARRSGSRIESCAHPGRPLSVVGIAVPGR